MSRQGGNATPVTARLVDIVGNTPNMSGINTVNPTPDRLGE
jgi:hypothetical protein